MSTLLLDAEALYADLRQGVQRLLAARPQGGIALVGIWSGGAWLVERLAADLSLDAHGVISSSLHRDDFGSKGMSVSSDHTRLPFEVDGRHIVLIDDVLYTGRTIRAVVNELYDFGRPASVQLAVLVDRGGRELPVQADFAAARVALPASQSLSLARDAQGRFNFSLEA